MKIHHTLIALVILLALGGTFYYLQKQPIPSADSVPKQKLFSFTPDQVQEFTLESSDQPPATFRRASGSPAGTPGNPSSAAASTQWQITSPAGIAGSDDQIQSFLQDVPGLQAAVLDSQSSAPASEYGLDHPQKTLKFTLKQGAPVTLLVGKENPSGFARYGQVSTSPTIYLLDTAETQVLQKTLFDLRDKRALPIDMNQAQQVELNYVLTEKEQSPAEIQKDRALGIPIRRAKFGMTKQGDQWQLTDPSVRTDFNNTMYLVNQLGGTQMSTVEEDSPKSLAPYGLDKPSIRVDVKTASGAFSLMVGKKKEDKKDDKDAAKSDGQKKADDPTNPDQKKSDAASVYYAKNSVWPYVFTINQMLYDQLNQALEGYRNRSLFNFETSNARRVEILGPSGEMRLDKQGDKWVYNNDPKAKFDSGKFGDFLDTIHNLRISHYTDDAPGHQPEYGLNQPWLKITVTYGDKNAQETVIFAKKDKKFYSARQGEPSVYELGPAEPDNLEAKLKNLKS